MFKIQYNLEIKQNLHFRKLNCKKSTFKKDQHDIDVSEINKFKNLMNVK